MTKKDFELIANGLNMALAHEKNSTKGKSTVHYIATQFADRMARENPRFDRARFLKACGF